MDSFAKNERDNIEDDELETLKVYGLAWLNANDEKIKISLKEGNLEEINYKKN